MDLLHYHCFKHLTETEQQTVRDAAKEVFLPVDTILYYAGDTCDDVLFLKSGYVRVYIQPEEIGTEALTLYELRSGSQCVVNLFSAIASRPTLATAQTTTPCEGWLIPKETLLWLIDHSPAFREFKIELCGSRLNALIAFLADVKFSNVEQQLLNWIYVQGHERIQITHEQIASAMGVKRETISRNLKKLEHKGHIRLGRGEIVVR